ncbi:MAG TPA: ATP-binding protein, partial [Nevskiaceae bacterium]
DARRVAEMRQFEGFNRLTAYLMHDLKNIAAQQGLLLQNAVQHKSNPAFIEDMLATVDNSVRRITTLLAQLRGETSVAAVANVRLRTIAEQAVAACTGRQPEPSCRWLAGADPWVCADAQQLTTVLAHLIRNAQDATMAHGHVKVELGQSDDQALLRIEDDGTGMDGEFIRTRLFAPFFTTKASRGMGIGAYQAREYVRSLQGALEVESTPGKGSVFTVKIPLVKTGDGVDARVTRRALS